ncbi:hypothetical protein Q0M41_14040, partial [Staphylococcus aureus]|nr:hypothetical protein [Staphylococcus aureus]
QLRKKFASDALLRTGVVSAGQLGYPGALAPKEPRRTMSAPKLPSRLAAMSDEINVAQEAWLWLKINLAHLTGALAVLVAGVI